MAIYKFPYNHDVSVTANQGRRVLTSSITWRDTDVLRAGLVADCSEEFSHITSLLQGVERHGLTGNSDLPVKTMSAVMWWLPDQMHHCWGRPWNVWYSKNEPSPDYGEERSIVDTHVRDTRRIRVNLMNQYICRWSNLKHSFLLRNDVCYYVLTVSFWAKGSRVPTAPSTGTEATYELEIGE